MQQKAIDAYKKRQKSERPDPTNMIRCYEQIMMSAAKHDPEGARQGLQILTDSLNFKPDPALGYQLVSLYQYCEKCLKKKQFDEVCRIIETLKNTWEKAIELDSTNLTHDQIKKMIDAS